MATVNPAGWNKNESDGAAGVGELEGAVVVSEGVAVGVSDGDELEEGEVDGAVADGEGRELDGVDGDFGGFGLEYEEVDDNDDGDDEEEEDSGDYT